MQPTRWRFPRLVITAISMVAEKSNAERCRTHFSAFDLSANSGFFYAETRQSGASCSAYLDSQHRGAIHVCLVQVDGMGIEETIMLGPKVRQVLDNAIVQSQQINAALCSGVFRNGIDASCRQLLVLVNHGRIKAGCRFRSGGTSV